MLSRAFLDSSIVLHQLLGQEPHFAGWGQWREAYVSELADIETRRVVDRLRLQGHLSAEDLGLALATWQQWCSRLGIVELSKAVLDRARQSFPAVVGTLDALHIATALAWQSQLAAELIFMTHDRQQAIAARAVGLRVAGLAENDELR